MKPTTILISSAAVLALGLSSWAVLGPEGGEESGTAATDDSAARFSKRPASKVGSPRAAQDAPRPTGPVKLSDRSTPTPTPESRGVQNLNKLLTPAQKASIAAARQQAASLPPGLAAKQPRVTPAKQRAITKMQEDLRTAVKTNPGGWIDTYASLNRDFNQSNRSSSNNGYYNGGGGYYNGGGNLPSTSPDPVEPTTPEPVEPVEPAPVEPVEPVEEAPELPLPIDEARQLAEKYWAEKGSYLEGPTDRDGRFQQ